MVEIYLNFHGSQLPFLSIPYNDVQRLSIHPFKWLRFVMFSICGTCGDLSATPDGPPVDYDSTELADNSTYHFKPLGDLIFVDFNIKFKSLSDQSTSETTQVVQADCYDNFRQDVLQRDGFCVITGMEESLCEAAYIIPRYKGDKYIQKVIQDRSALYGSISPSISNINAVENGVLLSMNAYTLLSIGAAAFLKTPNIISELQPDDIPRVNQGPISSITMDHFTLQQLRKPDFYAPEALASIPNPPPSMSFATGVNMDAMFQSGSLLPPAIILDYMYGVVAYKYWGNRHHGVVENCLREHTPVPLSNPHEHDHPLPTMGEMVVKAMNQLNLV